MDTLTERYISEVVRKVPESQRDELRDELRATIADTIDARDSPEAEREVLTEMGDPVRLAAEYADRPLMLIGPRLYPVYTWTLTMLFTVVLPIVTVIAVVVDIWSKQDFGSAIGTGVSTVLSVGTHMFAGLTAIFAFIDRFAGHDRLGGSTPDCTPDWTPDSLPEREKPTEFRLSNCAGVVFSALLLVAIVLQQVTSPFWADGQRLPILEPGLWSGWMWLILAGLAQTIVLEILAMTHRVWTMTMAVWYAVGEAVFGFTVAWLLYQQQLFNPQFWDHVNVDWPLADAVHNLIALGVVVVCATEAIKRLWQARK